MQRIFLVFALSLSLLVACKKQSKEEACPHNDHHNHQAASLNDKSKSTSGIIQVGKDFQPKSESIIPIKSLLQNAQNLDGKIVQIQGSVNAMCVHKRDWFAIQDSGPGKAYVRILTDNSFLVPEQAVGMWVEVEGQIDHVEVPPQVAQHYADSHGLNYKKGKDGTFRQVVLRSHGAKFKPGSN